MEIYAFFFKNFLTKQTTHVHVRVRLGFGFDFLFFFDLSGGNWCSFNNESGRISQESFALFSSWEGDFSGGSDGDKFFQTVGDTVWGGSDSWVTDVQRDSGNVVNTVHKFSSDVFFRDVENSWFESTAFVKALLNF